MHNWPDHQLYSVFDLTLIISGCMLQECFKYSRGVCCRSASNTPGVYVAANTPIMSVYVAGVLQTPQSCQCMLQECFKHHNNIRGAYCRSVSNTNHVRCVWSASNTHSCQCMFAGALQTIRNVYCRSILNTPIMSGVYVCCRNASNIPILSVYVAGVLQTPQ